MVEIKLVSGKFDYGLKIAKRVGGKYNPQTKTWSVPAGCYELTHLACSSWELVGKSRKSLAWGEDEYDNIDFETSGGWNRY